MAVISKINWFVLTWYCFVNHVFCDLCSLMAPCGCPWVSAILIHTQNKKKIIFKSTNKFPPMCGICNHFEVTLGIFTTMMQLLRYFIYQDFCNYLFYWFWNIYKNNLLSLKCQGNRKVERAYFILVDRLWNELTGEHLGCPVDSWDLNKYSFHRNETWIKDLKRQEI